MIGVIDTIVRLQTPNYRIYLQTNQTFSIYNLLITDTKELNLVETIKHYLNEPNLLFQLQFTRVTSWLQYANYATKVLNRIGVPSVVCEYNHIDCPFSFFFLSIFA